MQAVAKHFLISGDNKKVWQVFINTLEEIIEQNIEMLGTNLLAVFNKDEQLLKLLGREDSISKFKNNELKYEKLSFPICTFVKKNVGMLKIISFNNDNLQAEKNNLAIILKLMRDRLKIMTLENELTDKNKFEDAIANQVSEGIIFVNKDGIVKFMNKAGAKILKIDLEKTIGKHIKDIVDFRPVLLDVLESGKGYVDKEFFLKSHGELLHFIKSATVIKDEQGNIKGVLDTFREIKRVKKMVNVMTGAQANFSFADIIGESQEIKKCKRIAQIAAESESNVLIYGKTGTGKELFAQSIHQASARQDGPFLAINCAALPIKLIESELFGYVEGAFTGASKGGRPGKFEMANGGTIFLDEIGEMPLNMQVKLLRVIQEKKIMRIGGAEVIPVNVRMIAATNKNLFTEVEKNNFRSDLYYRLNVLNINIPSLKERGNDIKLLANHFLDIFVKKLVKDINGFTDEVLDYLMERSWPGNVRELENSIERLVNFARGNKITFQDVINYQNDQKEYHNQNYQVGSLDKNLIEDILSLSEMERKYIKNVLSVCDNNVSQAARKLGVSRTTIYKYIN